MSGVPHPSLGSRLSAWATILFFAFNGLGIGVWASSLPSLRDRFGMTGMMLPALLVALGLAAILGMQVAGGLVDRLGARRVSLALVPLLIVGILVIGFAPTYAVLVVGGVLLGLGNGGIDVAMNALGVAVEKRRPKPIMSLFHGTWSIGNFLGALIVLGLATALGAGAAALVGWAASLAAIIGVGVLIVAFRITPDTPVIDHVDAETGRKAPIPRSAYLLGLMAVAFGLGEGTAYDWSALHVADVAGIDSGQASVAVVVVSAFMVAIRLMGDFLVTTFGRRAVVRFGGTCASAGYLLAAVATPLPLLLVAWALVGFGMGMIAPQVYAVAGHSGGGRGLAVVVTFGYAMFLVGPAFIGLLVSALGIQHTMFVPGALLIGLILLAKVMPSREAELRAQGPQPA